MNENWPVEVRFGGLGGQGLVTLGAVLADAGARAGLRVAASQSYGSRARGGATRSDVILSAESIDFPHVHHPDVLVVLAQEAWDLYAPEVRPGGAVLYDEFFVKPAGIDGLRALGLPGTATALDQVGNKVAANFVMFGALLGFCDLVPAEVVRASIDGLVRARFLAVNTKAFELGWTLGEALAAGGSGPWR